MDIVTSLVIGRKGSSFKNKNVRFVYGFPLVMWPCAAARRSKYINKFYCSSDSDEILEVCEKLNYIPIKRPNHLAKPESQSCDAVRHAVKFIEENLKKKIDILVLQHANVGTITEHMIDACIDLLMKNPNATAVIPSHQKSDYHPARAKILNSDGFLEQAIEGKSSANRQDLNAAYFFDHSFWVIRGEFFKRRDGQSPWNCMGNRILPFETQGCFDVHSQEDLDLTANWLKENNIPSPIAK